MELKIWSVIPTGGVGGVLTVASFYVPALWLADVLLVMGVLLLAVAATVLIVWYRQQSVLIYEQRCNAEDRALALAQAARGMTGEQIAYAIGARRPEVDLELLADGRLAMYMRGTDVPLWFARYFLENSHGLTLCPIRRWGEGTHERRWAQMFTAMLINSGYAVEYRGGPYAAQWVSQGNRELLLRALPETEIEPTLPPSPGEMPPEGAEDARNRTHTEYYAKESEG